MSAFWEEAREYHSHGGSAAPLDAACCRTAQTLLAGSCSCCCRRRSMLLPVPLHANAAAAAAAAAAAPCSMLHAAAPCCSTGMLHAAAPCSKLLLPLFSPHWERQPGPRAEDHGGQLSDEQTSQPANPRPVSLVGGALLQLPVRFNFTQAPSADCGFVLGNR